MLEHVKGYKKLTEGQQKLFEAVFKRHNAGIGMEFKKEYMPVSVKWDNRGKFLKVVFKNGDWLHYTQNHDWY